MKVAVYGGSFNPPHVGHAMVASWVRWTGRAEEVWLVPVYQHAFEGIHGKRLAPFDERVRWCEALAADLGEGVRVCAVERELPAPSYTVQTLRHLRAAHPDHDFRLLIGADVLPQLPQWRDWQTIAREFSPVVVGRQGHAAPEGVAAVDFPAVSSTEIRARLDAGEPLDHLVTARVASALRDYWSAGRGT
jgi:nicotinate-nucleotide adenylyltransferase